MLRRRPSRTSALVLLGLVFSGCTAPVTAPPRTGPDVEPDVADPTPDAEPDLEPGPPPTVRLPQAIGGAMLVNPATFPTVRLRVEVTGDADSVSLTVDDEDLVLGPATGGLSLAELDVTGLSVGLHEVVATARRADGAEATARADLAVSPLGMQLTWFGDVGAAATPRLHRLGGEIPQLFLTWADRSDPDGVRRAFLRELDGAGRFVGPQIPLTPKDSEALYARCAIGGGHVAVLGQLPGGPYRTRLWITRLDGSVELGPIELDPEGWYGSFGGDVVYDEVQGFVFTWRVNDGQGHSEVRWLRVTDDLEVVGPSVVALSDTPAPWTDVEPFTFLSLAATPTVSVVAFTQNQHSSLLDLDVPRARLFFVSPEGALAGESGTGASWSAWEHEAHVSRVGDVLLGYWASSDLLSAEIVQPIGLYGAPLERGQDMTSPSTWTTDVGERFEPHVAPHAGAAVMAWLDLRSYAESAAGHIELRARLLVGDPATGLSPGPEVAFAHARFILGTSELRATSLGENVGLVWLDERHGNGITDPRPEVWFDTLWVE